MATNENENRTMTKRILGKDFPLAEVKRYTLKKGPALLDLIHGYAYAFPDSRIGRQAQKVVFTAEDGRELTMRILGLEHESGSESRHLIRGHIYSGRFVCGTLEALYEAEGSFDVDSRTGYLDVHEVTRRGSFL